MQGYLPVAVLAHAIKTKTALVSGFFNSGTQVVTAKSVDMGNGLPPVTFEQAGFRGRSGGDREILRALDRFAGRERPLGIHEADRHRVRLRG